MKWSVTVIAFFVTVAINAQTESISIVQYTASFAEQANLEVKWINLRPGS